MATDRPLYDRLGVAQDVSPDVLKKAYKKLARQHHPDLNPGDDAAEQRFKETSAAYEVLSDPKKRALYDEFGEDSTRLGFDPAEARRFSQWQESARRTRSGRPGAGMRGSGEPTPDLDDLLGDMFGGRARQQSGGRAARRGADMRAALQTDFRTAALGGERELTFSDGRTIRVRIPAGVRPQETIRIRGKGMPGDRGAPPGDLLVEMQVAPDPVFVRDGEDLRMIVPVTLGEAAGGARIRVPTLSGEVDLNLPAGVQTGSRLRLKGKGVTRSGKAGDLFAEVRVVLPPGDALKKVPEAIEAIEALYDGDVRAELKGGA